MVSVVIALIMAGCALGVGATGANAIEELVFISDPADAAAVQAAGFDGVVIGGVIHRFALPGADQPYFDEPEEHPDTSLFLQWWAQYGATGLVLHWNPATANSMGVWKNPPTVSWNWYPATRWTPSWAWPLYLPLQFLQYHDYITAPNGYGTLQAFSGWDEAPLPGEAKPLDYYYPSDSLMTTMRQQFRDGLGASFKGYIWFIWSGPYFPDSLSMHPNWWPVNRGERLPLALTSLTANLNAPQNAGTTVTFTAITSGGTQPAQYRWWVYDGATWTIMQDWSPTNTFGWTPTQANPAYQVAVWARSAGLSGEGTEVSGWLPFAITARAPLALTSLTANLNAPQNAGTTVTFTAITSGGTQPAQYRWWVYDGSTWTVMQDWSPTNTFGWTPTQANPAYQVAVWARSAGLSGEGTEVSGWLPFAISN